MVVELMLNAAVAAEGNEPELPVALARAVEALSAMAKRDKRFHMPTWSGFLTAAVPRAVLHRYTDAEAHRVGQQLRTIARELQYLARPRPKVLNFREPVELKP